VQCLGDGPRLALAQITPSLGVESRFLGLALDAIERPEDLERLGRDLTAQIFVQRVELSPRMRHAADLGHAVSEERVVALIIIADE
jgi:hypothetical protein